VRRRLRYLELQAACVFDGPVAGQKVFMKLRASDTEQVAAKIRTCFTAERVALRVLEGLAVPRLVPMRLADIPAFGAPGGAAFARLPRRGTGVILETYEGEPFHNHGRLTPRGPIRHLVGVWLFCLEQFVAFRRHQLLYTDIKCRNIVSPRGGVPRVVIVDFDHVIPLVGRRRWDFFGLTQGFDPPEIRAGQPPTEASCVYQLGILMFHFLTGMDNRKLADPRHGLGKMCALLTAVGAGRIAAIVERCVRADPPKRYCDFEAVFAEVLSGDVPAPITRHWTNLRAPYATRLASMDLPAPE
jgi:hypothetical protein